MKIQQTAFVFCCLLSSLGVLAAPLKEHTTTLKQQTGLSLTIYNSDLALVRDQRNLKLPTGLSRLAIRDVSGKMRPETALLRSVNHPGALKVREQDFNFDLLTPQKMLDKYVGKEVQIFTINPATGKKTTRKATILSTNNGVVAKIGHQIETNPQGHYIFPSIPQNLRDKPTLVTTLYNSIDTQQTLELSYLTRGLSWKADYVVKLGQNDSRMDLAGWVTLTNQSGTTYPQAHVQLVAGDVNQVQPQYDMMVMKARAYAAAPAPNQEMTEESLFEYHLYSLPHATDIADNQTKQVTLLSASGIQAKKQLILEGSSYYYTQRYDWQGQKLKTSVHLKFKNSKDNQLGMPLPKGVIRVYKQDNKGQLQFVGEDRIEHTANQENIDLTLGESFDVSAIKTQTDFSRQNHGHPYKYAAKSSFTIELKNGKQEPVEVIVREPIPHDWKITKESHPHKKIAANQVEWVVPIDPEQSTVLSYSVLVRY